MTRDRHLFVPAPLRPLSRAIGLRYRRAAHALRNLGSVPQTAPIFVLGNQRSGTSAIAALLGRACGLSVSVDMLMEVSRPTIQRMSRGELSFDDYVRAHRFEFSHDVVKEPSLTFFHRELALRFPESRFVFIVRDPRDNVRSQLDAMEIPGDLAKLDERYTRNLYPGWDLVLDGRWIGIDGGEHYVDRLAARWARCAEICLELGAAVSRCRYEDFLADKTGELARLADALGQPVVADVSAEVDVQYQTRGDASVAWREFFGAENLARIERICAEGMRAFGYATSG